MTLVPSEDERGRPLRRSSQARSWSRSVSVALSEQGRPFRKLGVMRSDEWVQPMDPPCTQCKLGECIISTHPDRPPTGKVTACNRCHFAKAKCTQPPPTTRHRQAAAKVANATASSSWPSTGKKIRRAQAMEPAGPHTPAPKLGKTVVSRRSPSPPTDELFRSGGKRMVASMPPKRCNMAYVDIVVPPARTLHVPWLGDTLVQLLIRPRESWTVWMNLGSRSNVSQ
ncbi:hypothetical protein AcV5_007888 [Taiwanofungus camphoratus]|nr:hypothetical protein AcV5_007888 [Antrodia cinnamomea]